MKAESERRCINFLTESDERNYLQDPDESADVITELVQQLGGSVENMSEDKTPKKKEKAAKKGKANSTFMFGKWKDFNIDARKLREEAWTRKF